MTAITGKKLVVLGSGFGSFSLVKDIDAGRFDVSVVSPRNHFLFTPLLPSTTVGTIEFRSIIEPVRTARRKVAFYLAYAQAIDTDQHLVVCRGAMDGNTFSIPYDTLVIGVGAVSATYGIPGVAEYAIPLKELSDARAIRQRIIENFERAMTPGLSFNERRQLLHFVVAGGGPTGVEFAAELHDFLTEDLNRLYPAAAPDVTITLLEASGNILSAFDAALSEYTLSYLRRHRISVRTHTPVVKIGKNEIVLKDGSVVPYGLLVWSAGNAQTPFVASLPFEKDRAGRIITDGGLRVPSAPGIFAVGDCMAIRGQVLPATSQVAQQEGRYLARSLNAYLRGRETRPFRYHHHGMLAYIGGNRALADLPQLKWKGFDTWLFWRSAYLTKLVSLKNKILVVFDWCKTFVFGRDASRF